MVRWTQALVFGSVACALTACSLLLGTSGDQCASDGDCTARGGAFAGSRCVDTVCVAAPTVEGGADAHLDARGDVASESSAADVGGDVVSPLACLGGRPAPTIVTPATASWYLHDSLQPNVAVTSVVVTLCPSSADPFCSGPLGTKRPNSGGIVTFTLDLSAGPFTGYIRIDPYTPGTDAGAGDAAAPEGGTGDAGRDGAVADAGHDAGGASGDGGAGTVGGNAYLPARVSYAAEPIYGNFSDDWQLLTGDDVAAFASLYGVAPLSVSDGLTVLVTYDCQGNPLPGVRGAVDSTLSSTSQFYFVNGAPTTTAMATDSSGYIGWTNLHPGARTYTATVVASGATLSTLTMYSYPGTISFGPMAPPYGP